MKKILMMTCFALAFAGLTGTSFAKSKAKSKSSKSSSSSSGTTKPAHNTTSSTKPDAGKKQAANTDKDKDSKMRKNTKTHHCRLPDGSINREASQDLCLKVGGQWVKY